MDGLNKWVTENPFIYGLLTLFIGIYFRDWITAGKKFIGKKVSSLSERSALARIKVLEKEVKNREKYISDPQVYNHFVWHKIFSILSKIIVFLAIFAVLPFAASIIELTYPQGTPGITPETQQKISGLYYLIPYMGFILIFFDVRIFASFLKDIRDFDTYKNKVLAEIDSLKKKYPASIQVQQAGMQPNSQP